MSGRVLIVDDEADVGRLLSFALAEAGFETEAVDTASAALEAIARARPAVIVLDLMLPDLSGHEVCRRLRGDPAMTDVGILMLTARGDEYDRVVGLEMGADDYVVKPFSVREVVLRTQNLVRRISERAAPPAGASARLLQLGEIEVDLRTYEVRLAGELVALRPLELRLLATLMSDPGRVFSRTELLDEVWGVREAASTRTVDVHIKRLRENLGRAARHIETVHGFGYRARRARGWGGEPPAGEDCPTGSMSPTRHS
ncbi:MAG TPA: response regulator transcription factor [Kofleriaceae bacterium]|nr:response regulator transcription factor [Kofleriaceae bacterium]